MALLNGEGGGGGTAIIEVANYSALPAANTVPGKLYAVLASQGTAWLPGSWGGTYYGKGLYYSDGAVWTFTETPYNATQATVDTGTNDDQFVTSKTFTNAAKWALYQLALTAANFGSFINGLTDKTTPVDADYIPLMDSADSNNTKKLSWANLKATLAVLFGRSVGEWYSDATALSPGDGGVYYFSRLNNNATETVSTYRPTSVKANGTWSVCVNGIITTTLGSGEGATVELLNITAGTSITLTTSFALNKRVSTSGIFYGTLASAVDDEMQIRVTFPAWATNPTNVQLQFFLKQY